MATVVEQEAVLDEERLVTEFMGLPKSTPPKTRLTFEQASKLAAGRSFELIQGRMVFKMPDDKHSDTQVLLGAELVNYFKANPIGRVRTEFSLRLWPENPYEARTPDLSVILNESFREERYGSRAPDLAIEILSRDDSRNELFEKAKLYFEKGSRMVWMIDPYQKGVMVITPNDQRWVTDVLTCPELLPGFAVRVQDILAWPEVVAKATE
jgi:Uma2 family endonuclease